MREDWEKMEKFFRNIIRFLFTAPFCSVKKFGANDGYRHERFVHSCYHFCIRIFYNVINEKTVIHYSQRDILWGLMRSSSAFAVFTTSAISLRIVESIVCKKIADTFLVTASKTEDNLGKTLSYTLLCLERVIRRFPDVESIGYHKGNIVDTQ